MHLNQATIDDFFGTIAKKYPGLDNGAEGVRIILSYNRSMTGTDYINFEIERIDISIAKATRHVQDLGTRTHISISRLA